MSSHHPEHHCQKDQLSTTCAHSHHDCTEHPTMGQLLHCLIELRHQTQVAHWLVSGPYFSSWHEMYEQHYHQVNTMIDDLVEHLLGHGSLDTVLCTHSCDLALKQDSPKAAQERMSRLLNHIHSIQKDCSTLLSKEQSFCFQDLITEILRGLEKQAWFYKSSLAQG